MSSIAKWFLPAGLAAVVALLAPASFARGDDDKSDIVDTAVAAGSFKTLATALKAADLVDTLKGDGPFTVFAPTDDAFEKLPAGTLDALLKDKAKLKAVLLYHVVKGEVKAADVVKLKSAKTVGGESVEVDATDGVKINDAKVVKADIECSNGVIHVIDAVLVPDAK
ncbi:fasciclin domain-containing protein [Paludisphaera sp.]|uniref:fasciclin domain-containing protein n=1 Tax=Paludisphaera sp. TaxID=2017432 RepID=UPI00301B7B2B